MSTLFITLDFETFYQPGYNIKALGPSQYVKHEWFWLNSVAMKVKGKPCHAVGGHEEVCKAIRKLKRMQDAGRKIVICGQNLYFDAFILSHHFDFVPSFYIDTLCMANSLHAHDGPTDLNTLSTYYGGDGKVSGTLDDWKGLWWEEATEEQREELLYYNKRDVIETERVALEMLKVFPEFELRVIDLTLRMFTEPTIQIDVDLAKQILEDEIKLKEDTAAACGVPQEVFRSNDKFAALLEDEGYDVPMKYNDKGNQIHALAQADIPFQRMLKVAKKEGDDRFIKLCEARKVCKSSITSSRAKGLIERADHPFPIGLMYCSAHTMRWGGTDKMNPQNLPRKGKLRHCLRADKGMTFVIVDASQIEARDNAAFSEQWDLVDDFARGVDVYCDFASDLYGFEVNKDDHPKERFVGKTSILGLGYQMGAQRFQDTLEAGMMGPPLIIDFDEAQRTVNLYRSRYDKIKLHWRILGDLIPALLPGGSPVEHRGVVISPGKVLMPNGLHLHYPNVGYTINPDWNTPDFYYESWDYKTKSMQRNKLYGGLFLENLVQCRARIMTTEHMVELANHYRVVMMAHDEIVMHVPIAKADQCLNDAIEIMSIPPRWNEKCPLAAEGSIKDHYIKD